jgi:alpha-galactosidase
VHTLPPRAQLRDHGDRNSLDNPNKTKVKVIVRNFPQFTMTVSMTRPPALALTTLALLILPFGRNPAQTSKAAQPPAAVDSSAKPQIESKLLRVEFDHNLHTRVVPLFDATKPLTQFSASETMEGATHTFTDFALTSAQTEQISDDFGPAQRLTVTGNDGTLRKKVEVTIYNDFPSMAVFEVEYTNQGATPLTIRGWSNNHYRLRASTPATTPAFWSYQSGSYEKRPNWIVPLHTGFHQQNYLGMNASDYGGGTPIIDVWRKDVGLAVGHIEPVPRLI